jgi:hypothetical protein
VNDIDKTCKEQGLKNVVGIMISGVRLTRPMPNREPIRQPLADGK